MAESGPVVEITTRQDEPSEQAWRMEFTIRASTVKARVTIHEPHLTPLSKWRELAAAKGVMIGSWRGEDDGYIDFGVGEAVFSLSPMNNNLAIEIWVPAEAVSDKLSKALDEAVRRGLGFAAEPTNAEA